MTKKTGQPPTTSQLLCIQGGIVIDPCHVNGRADVLIQDGNILEVGFPLTNPLCQDSSVTILEANGWIVAPGLVDLHCHLREPGFEYKETISTGAASAVAGGFT